MCLCMSPLYIWIIGRKYKCLLICFWRIFLEKYVLRSYLHFPLLVNLLNYLFIFAKYAVS